MWVRPERALSAGLNHDGPVWLYRHQLFFCLCGGRHNWQAGMLDLDYGTTPPRNGSCVEEIWNNFKNIVYESIESFVPRKILRKISDPEYYNKEIKRLKSKVRKAYN